MRKWISNFHPTNSIFAVVNKVPNCAMSNLVTSKTINQYFELVQTFDELKIVTWRDCVEYSDCP